ncbi:MAG: CAP domain-containing protein [Pseudomonadota bacterium]
MYVVVLFALANIADRAAAFDRTIALPAMPTNCAIANADPDRVRERINTIRERSGLRPLRQSRVLVRAGDRHVRNLIRRGKLSHRGGDGRYFEHRVWDLDYDGTPRAENLAWNQARAKAVVAAWMKSPSHRRAILLPDVTDIGISYRCSTARGHFWSMIVGRSDREHERG